MVLSTECGGVRYMSSQLGVEFALVALPVLAVKELHASAFEVGAVTDASTAVDVLLALPAGSVGHGDRDEAAGACVCRRGVRIGLLDRALPHLPDIDSTG